MFKKSRIGVLLHTKDGKDEIKKMMYFLKRTAETRINSSSLMYSVLACISFVVPCRPFFPFSGSTFSSSVAPHPFRRISVDPLGMAEADITSVVPCGSVQFRPV